MIFDDKLHEECGVFGVYSNSEIDVSSLVYYGLYSLQHRGQESAGIVVYDGANYLVKKGMGLVSEVFNETSLKPMTGRNAIGHVRYSTTGSSDISNAQPIVAQCKLGQIAIAHNGNIVNADILRDILEDSGIVFQSTSDSEVILNLISRSLKYGLESALLNSMGALNGSYAIVMMVQDKLIGIRDNYGIRPLCMGKIDDNYILASESCALDAVGAEFVRDIEPGEIVIIDKNGIKSIKQNEKAKCATCSFEYIYFARPDSVIDGIDVYTARRKSGEILFEENPVEADLVTGVPDSGVIAAFGYSKVSGIPYGIALVKNKYVGRSFIAPSQELREKVLNVKLNVIKNNVRDKRVILIDDSIVRGTTAKKLIQLLRNAGAKEVHLRISSPPVVYPCYYGIDISRRSELIASNMTIEEMRKELNVDSLAFLSINGLLKALDNKQNYCLGCFKGIYPVSARIKEEENESL